MADQLEYPLGMGPAAREPRESTVWIKIAGEATQVGSIPAPGGDFVFEVVWADLVPLVTKNRVESTLPESAWEHMAKRAYARDFDELARRLDEGIGAARTAMDRLLAMLQVPPDPMPGPTPPAPESVTMADVDEILERIGAGIAARGAAMDRVLAKLASNGPDQGSQRMALLEIPARLWTFARKIEDLMAVQAQTEKALATVTGRLRALEDRMTHLEAAQGQIVVEARSAASAAATTVAGAVISDVVTRVTRIEMRTEDATRRIQGSERR